MSLYREAGRRRRWIPVAIGLAVAVGFLSGFFARPTGGSEPSLAAALQHLQRELRLAVDAVELVPVEYGVGVHDGQIVSAIQYGAAKVDLRRARDSLAKNRTDLAALAPGAPGRAEARLGQLAALIERRAPQREVAAQARRIEQTIRAGARLP